MKKVFRVRCEVDNSCTIEKYDTYVFAHDYGYFLLKGEQHE